MSTKTNQLSTTPTLKSKQQNLMVLGGIVAVALLAAVIFIVINSSGSLSSGLDYSTIPQSRAEDGAFVLGDPEAPVTIVEFADFMCPHCQGYKPTMDRVVKELVATGQAKFEFRMLPTQPTISEYSAQLAECADKLEPGSFWKAYDVLYDMGSRGRFTLASGQDFANRMGLNYAELLNCKDSARQVRTDQMFGTRLEVSGTPTLLIRYGDDEPTVIGGTNVTFEEIRDLVQQAN